MILNDVAIFGGDENEEETIDWNVEKEMLFGLDIRVLLVRRNKFGEGKIKVFYVGPFEVFELPGNDELSILVADAN